MAKNDKATEAPRPDVVWTLIKDGLQPRPAPWGFVVQNPVMRALPPGKSMEIRLGVASSVPVLAWPRGDAANYVTVPQFIPAGQEIVAMIENKSEHVAMIIDDCEVLVNIHPLVFHGTGGVG